MTVAPYAPGSVIEELAVFPLPDAVLFPGMLMPLHIFELRYRAMTEQVLAGSKQIAIARILPHAPDGQPLPEIATVAGVGEIVQHKALSDGRYNIVLSGMARVRLTELPFVAPFRRARAEVLPSDQGNASEADVAALVYSATRFAAQLRQRDAKFEFHLPNAPSPATMVDACAHQLIVESEERQQILETLPLGPRVRRCIEVLAIQAAMLDAQTGDDPS